MRLAWALGGDRFHIVDLDGQEGLSVCGTRGKLSPAHDTAPEEEKCKRCQKWWFLIVATNPAYAEFVSPPGWLTK